MLVFGKPRRVDRTHSEKRGFNLTLFSKKDRRAHSELETIVSAYERQLLVYVARITGSPSFAEDIVQEAFIKLAQQWRGPMEVGAQISAWLYKVSHNEAIDYIRKEKRRGEINKHHVEERGETVPPSEGQGINPNSFDAQRVLDALEVLNERERNLVVLKVYEEKSYKEIAAITGLSTGNVGFILHKAMQKLAGHFGGEEGRRNGN